MATARELYPDIAGKEDGDAYFYGPSDYQPILNTFGEIVVQVDDDDCQGDSRVLYRDGDRYGVLIFGWGSCSGCDALQACDNFAEIDALIDRLRGEIRWDTRDATLEYLKTHDWEGDYSWHAEETREFIAKAITALSD